MKIDRHHWRMVTSESEALQVLNKCSAGEFGLSLFLMTAVLEVFRRCHTKYITAARKKPNKNGAKGLLSKIAGLD
jgi:hypothetical protein